MPQARGVVEHVLRIHPDDPTPDINSLKRVATELFCYLVGVHVEPKGERLVFVAAAFIGHKPPGFPGECFRLTGNLNRGRSLAISSLRYCLLFTVPEPCLLVVTFGSPMYSTFPDPLMFTSSLSLATTVALPLPSISTRASLLLNPSP